MSDYSVGALARCCGVSRSTLLHYERLGLLIAAGRSEANYRRYSEADRQRLLRIREYRALGLELQAIKTLLDSDDQGVATALRRRFDQLSEEVAACRRQQQQIVRLLQGCGPHRVAVMDKAGWTELMRASGMDDADMRRWHAEFEKRSPAEHRRFLLGLGVDEQELERILRWAREFRP